MQTVSRDEALGMLKVVDGPVSVKVENIHGSVGYHTAVSRNTFVRAAIFHEWNEFGARDLRKFEPKAKVVANPCIKCGGTGIVQHCSHVENGVCFRCNGTGLGKK